MVKTDYGVIRGESKFLRCFSRDPVTKEGFKEFTDEAGAMVKKRDKLEWESFDTFVEDVKRFPMVEEAVLNTGDTAYYCSCYDGRHGNQCIHVLAVKIQAKIIPEVTYCPIANTGKGSRKDSTGLKGKAPRQQKKY